MEIGENIILLAEVMKSFININNDRMVQFWFTSHSYSLCLDSDRRKQSRNSGKRLKIFNNVWVE